MKLKLYFLVLTIGLFAFKNAVAENERKKLYDLTWDLLIDNPDSSIFYAKILREKSLESRDNLNLVNSYYVEGYAYYYKNQYDQAAIKYYKGLNLIKYEGLTSLIFKERELYLLNNLGLLYELTYGYDEAIRYYTEALEIAQNINSIKDIAGLHYNLGVIYYHLHKYDEAEKNYTNALNYYKKLNSKSDLIETYNLFGNLYLKKSSFKKAKDYYNRAIQLSNQFNLLKNKKSWYISNLGETYFLQKNYDSAIYYYNQALFLSLELNDIDKIKWLNNNLGDVYFSTGDYNNAISYYKRILDLEGNDVIDEESKRACKNLSEAYEKANNLEMSIVFHKKFIHQAELLQTAKNKLEEQNAQYRMKEVEWMMEKQLKEQKIHQMERVNFWFKITVSLLLLILFVSAYKAYRYYSGVQAVKKWLAS